MDTADIEAQAKRHLADFDALEATLADDATWNALLSTPHRRALNENCGDIYSRIELLFLFVRRGR